MAVRSGTPESESPMLSYLRVAGITGTPRSKEEGVGRGGEEHTVIREPRWRLPRPRAGAGEPTFSRRSCRKFEAGGTPDIIARRLRE